MRSRNGRVGRVVAAGSVAALLTLATLAGCSGGASDMGASGGSTESVEGPAPASAAHDQAGDPERPAGGDAGGGDAGRTGGGVGQLNRAAISTRAVIRTGEVVVVARDMSRALEQVDALLGRHGGYLASEDTRNDRSGEPEWSMLVLRVPEPAFGTVINELRGLGRPLRTDRSSDDVSTELIDVNSRVATHESSIARLQRFLRRATHVEDMIRIESEIATRQAELESLKAQQTYLRDQTAMSSITLQLRASHAAPPEPEDDAGFLAGLGEGWSALKTVLVGALTVAGLLLPFAVAAALVGVPLWLLVRAARRRRPATTEPTPEAG